jgi:hypothetical protein
MKPRALLISCLCAIVIAAHTAAQGPARVLAIGDIHGSFDGFVTILARTRLVDANRQWIGGEATLVQTGDYTDRGDGVRPVMDLLMALEPQARKAGGQLIALVGNHEVMNLVGETRDVTAAIFATFGDADSEKRREAAWRDYEQLAKRRHAAADAATIPAVYAQTKETWMAAHPPGFVEYRQALGPRGTYGRWLRSKAAAARINGTAFMHAGVDPANNEMTLEELNAKVKEELARFDAFVNMLVDRKLALPSFTLQEVLQVTGNELNVAIQKQAAEKSGQRNGKVPSPSLDERGLQEALAVYEVGKWAILAPEGPLWFRGYTTWPETAAPNLTAVLQRFRADRIVTAHTPQPQGAIVPRFGNRLFLIDTGMLASVYKGRPSALEIDGTRISAIYPEDQVVLVDK